jgi:sugar/nucleoside kinase (ribokinase family)
LKAGISKDKLPNAIVKMKDGLTFANQFAALVCTKPGAMSALPTQDDLKKAKIK